MKTLKLFPVLLAAALSAACAIPTMAADTDTDYVNAGPGVVHDSAAAEEEEAVVVEVVEETLPQEPEEISLGTFKITGYCGCSKCSGSNPITYSGVMPTPNHTISADLSHLPLGTRLRIGDTVYTVEDMGSGISGNILDIFYASHQEALNNGIWYSEVFLVK